MYNNNKIYWFTGQPGSGKTVLSNRLKNYIEQIYNKKVFHIDGDDLRTLFKNTNYGKEGRQENIKRAQDISKFIHSQGYDVIVSLVSPYKEMRDQFKKEMNGELLEIFLHTKEIRGRENFHTDEYVAPTEDYISIDTTNKTPKESFREILNQLN
jgi:adenylylsulfate kinase